MSYAIVWQPNAVDELAAIWLHVSDRTGLTQIAELLERHLSTDPRGKGESRIGTQRIYFLPPLGVRYEVIEDDRQVRILAVWLTQSF